ncbi:MAG: response regulator [Patescibacteria group bacterium]|nr:response regulator [Patescibacteria group bacterium]MBU2509417.1 response regulator [Patescibacteria group bacterium]
MSSILLIEDDNFLATIYSQKLELEGFDVLVANNGEDGLRLALKEQPSLILLDLILPKLDGFEVLEKLKAEPQTMDVPVLVLTNMGQQEDVARCTELGAAGYLIKAHSLPDETVKKIRAVLTE